jgi:hypothetical protein
MAQMGHTDPTVTLGLYAKAMSATEENRERLRTVVGGAAQLADVEQVGDQVDGDSGGDARPQVDRAAA